jgi:hypothetical protein
MRQYELTKKEREKIFQLVGEDPTYSDISQLFLYRDKWRKLDFFVFTLNNTPPSDPAYPLVIGLEELLSKPLSRTDWVELRDEIIQTRFEPAPRTPLFRFNDIATHLPFLMRFEGRRITGNIEIQATTLPLPIFEILLKDNPELQKKLISDPERSRFITKRSVAFAENGLWTALRIKLRPGALPTVPTSIGLGTGGKHQTTTLQVNTIGRENIRNPRKRGHGVNRNPQFESLSPDCDKM